MKIGIITINDNNNYGNRLQNYAVQEILNKKGHESITILNNGTTNKFEEKKYMYILRLLKVITENQKIKLKNRFYKRYKFFKEFNKNINYSKKCLNLMFKEKIEREYDFFIVGSDQVWNPNFNRLTYVDLLSFVSPKKRISFSASFGIDQIPNKYDQKIKEEISKFKAISVREDIGKKKLEELTGRTDIEVLVDPTMLLNSEEWDKVSKKPKQLQNEKYILNYFLGNLSEERKNEINRIAKENGCKVINLLDKSDPFYETGPSEFLYLEKHAFLICTDSFHSSIFAILYNKPFIVFNREGNTACMNSRIETLLSKFKLKNRIFTKKITNENLQHDYNEAYIILEQERKKANDFLKKYLQIDNRR